MQPVWMSTAAGKCDLAQKRDLYDLDVQVRLYVHLRSICGPF